MTLSSEEKKRRYEAFVALNSDPRQQTFVKIVGERKKTKAVEVKEPKAYIDEIVSLGIPLTQGFINKVQQRVSKTYDFSRVQTVANLDVPEQYREFPEVKQRIQEIKSGSVVEKEQPKMEVVEEGGQLGAIRQEEAPTEAMQLNREKRNLIKSLKRFIERIRDDATRSNELLNAEVLLGQAKQKGTTMATLDSLKRTFDTLREKQPQAPQAPQAQVPRMPATPASVVDTKRNLIRQLVRQNQDILNNQEQYFDATMRAQSLTELQRLLNEANGTASDATLENILEQVEVYNNWIGSILTTPDTSNVERDITENPELTEAISKNQIQENEDELKKVKEAEENIDKGLPVKADDLVAESVNETPSVKEPKAIFGTNVLESVGKPPPLAVPRKIKEDTPGVDAAVITLEEVDSSNEGDTLPPADTYSLTSSEGTLSMGSGSTIPTLSSDTVRAPASVASGQTFSSGTTIPNVPRSVGSVGTAETFGTFNIPGTVVSDATTIIPDVGAMAGNVATDDGTVINEEVVATTQEPETLPPGRSAAALVEGPLKAEYHKVPTKLYFGTDSQLNGLWDDALMKDIESLELSEDEIAELIDMIITVEPKMLIKERKSKTKEELNEVAQLLFCIERNLQRGTRQKMAQVPLGQLLKLGSDVNMSRPQAPVAPVDPFVEANTMQVPETQNAGVPAESAASKDVEQQPQIIKSTGRIEIDDIAKLYKKRKYGKTGIIDDANVKQIVYQVRNRPSNQVIMGSTNSDDLFDVNWDRVKYKMTKETTRRIMRKGCS